jgi:hypothetical protein
LEDDSTPLVAIHVVGKLVFETATAKHTNIPMEAGPSGRLEQQQVPTVLHVVADRTVAAYKLHITSLSLTGVTERAVVSPAIPVAEIAATFPVKRNINGTLSGVAIPPRSCPPNLR